MKVQATGYSLQVSEQLALTLENEVKRSGKSTASGVYVIFRDSDYSHETGGFHPVEVMLSAEGSIQYITDFAYAGDPPELAKELDFDFSQGTFCQMGTCYPIDVGRGLFNIWQENFCAYYDSGVFEVIVREVC